ncbi:MAG TPA: signal recognition particle protein [Burkholderiales bacterium]
MFDHLTERLARAIKTLRGEARLTESNVQEALREVRVALLEADVALPVVKKFIDGVRGKALGEEVVGSLTPGQAAVGVVYRELVALMGERNDALNLATQPPAVILLAGLQGSGKTTTAAKLARWLKNELQKKVVLASCDVYRPAAIEQLKTLAAQVSAEFFPSAAGEKPADIAARALGHSRTHYADVLIVDSAGRLAIDEAMMREIAELNAVLKPIETLYVVDAMQGQDAVNTARAFADALPLTGIILTKLDGDARGGAALSVHEVTGRPIKFAGVGEKLDALEPFHPDRMASRILGMGDVLSLIEDVTKSVDRAQVEKLAQKVKSGKDFDLEDFKQQVVQMKKMGGLAALADKLPGNLAQLAQGAPGMDDKAIRRLEGIINSMTREERARPELIKASRKRRIAAGAGVTVQEVNRLLNQFEQAQKMMKMMSSKGGIAQMMRSMKGMFPGMR